MKIAMHLNCRKTIIPYKLIILNYKYGKEELNQKLKPMEALELFGLEL